MVLKKMGMTHRSRNCFNSGALVIEAWVMLKRWYWVGGYLEKVWQVENSYGTATFPPHRAFSVPVLHPRPFTSSDPPWCSKEPLHHPSPCRRGMAHITGTTGLTPMARLSLTLSPSFFSTESYDDSTQQLVHVRTRCL